MFIHTGAALIVVGAALGLVPQLHYRHDVQNPVDAPVPGAGEPVAGLVAGGRVQRRGAVPGGEPVASGEPADVADVGEQLGGARGPDAVQLHQGGSARGNQLGELPVQSPGSLVDALELSGQLDGEPPATRRPGPAA